MSQNLEPYRPLQGVRTWLRLVAESASKSSIWHNRLGQMNMAPCMSLSYFFVFILIEYVRCCAILTESATTVMHHAKHDGHFSLIVYVLIIKEKYPDVREYTIMHEVLILSIINKSCRTTRIIPHILHSLICIHKLS